MLKIKDNYDLQQLTEYGFTKHKSLDIWEYTMVDDDEHDLVLLVNTLNDKDRVIRINSFAGSDGSICSDILGDPTVLYRMIMDGIVEVVE